MNNSRPLAFLLCLLFVVAGLTPAHGQSGSMQIIPGDDASYAMPEFQVADEITEDLIPSGIFWIRVPIALDEAWTGPPVLEVNLSAAFEVYWDGELIGRAGVPGATPGEERPGPSIARFELRVDDVRAGQHLIAVRASNWRLNEPATTGIRLDLVERSKAQTSWLIDAFTMGAIGFSGTLIALFFLWAVTELEGRRKSLLLAALSITTVTIVMLANWPDVVGLSYEFGFERQVVLFALSLAMLGMLTALMLGYLRMLTPLRCLFLSAVILLLALVPVPALEVDHDVRVFGLLALASLALAVWRTAFHNDPVRVVGVASFVLLIAIVLDPAQLNVFLFAVVLMASAKAATDFRSAGLRAAQGEAQASRLELELIKRSIQPHFLMNTLAATQELIETAPDRASQFVEALALEFQSLLGVLGQERVPLTVEIALCSHYLSVMGLRFESNFPFRVSGEVEGINVPPGILHALVENAFSHGTLHGHGHEFSLDVVRQDTSVQLTLSVPSAEEASPSPMSSGAGMRYVRARLREAFGSQWRVESKRLGGHWVTTVELR